MSNSSVPVCAWLHHQQPVLQVYKAKMGNMDVAVKTIHRQHVNPHFTAKEALQVIKWVHSCSLAAVVRHAGQPLLDRGPALDGNCVSAEITCYYPQGFQAVCQLQCHCRS